MSLLQKHICPEPSACGSNIFTSIIRHNSLTCINNNSRNTKTRFSITPTFPLAGRLERQSHQKTLISCVGSFPIHNSHSACSSWQILSPQAAPVSPAKLKLPFAQYSWVSMAMVPVALCSVGAGAACRELTCQACTKGRGPHWIHHVWELTWNQLEINQIGCT